MGYNIWEYIGIDGNIFYYIWEYLGYEGFPWDMEVYPYWNIYIWIDTNSVCIYIYIYINIWDMRYSQQPWWFLMVAYPWEDPVFRRGGHGLHTDLREKASKGRVSWMKRSAWFTVGVFIRLFIGINGI